MKRFLVIVLLRLATGLAQFIVVILLAVSLSLENLGTYSLLVIYLTYAVQFASLSFYTYTLREQIVAGRDGWPALVQRQLLFLTVSTAAICLLILSLQNLGALQLPALRWFLPLIWLSVFNTQHENFFIGAGWPVAAAISLFIRTCWIYGVGLLNVAVPGFITLDTILLAWTLAELSSATFILVILIRQNLLPLRWLGFDFRWLAKGLRVGLHYTLLSVFLIVSFSIQRVVLANMEGHAAAGTFHFFFVISVFGPNLLEASLYAVLLPKLVARAKSRSGEALPLPEAWLFAVLGGLSTIGLITLYFVLPFFIELLDKQELYKYFNILPMTAFYALLYTIARIFHYNLYAANTDRWLLIVNSIACAVACVTSVGLIVKFGIDGAAWALLATGATLLVGNSLPFINKTARRIALQLH